MSILCDGNILVRANEKATGPARRLVRTILLQGRVLLVSGEMLVELAHVL